MAQYNYDGGLAAYFLLTFLALLLIPFTISVLANLSKSPCHLDTVNISNYSFTESSPPIEGCQCQECIANREEIQRAEGSSFLKSGLNAKYVAMAQAQARDKG
jgi:translocation protein SEC63